MILHTIGPEFFSERSCPVTPKLQKRLMKQIPTLYEWAGDQETFEKLFTRFYDKVLRDELLGEVFRHMSPEHVTHVAHFVAEVFGGEKLYTENGGSHATMVGKHVDGRKAPALGSIVVTDCR